MTRATIIALLVFLACHSSGKSAVDVDSLLLKAIGGPAARDSLKAWSSFKIEGEVRLNDLVGRFVEYFAHPHYFYLKLDFGGFSLVQGFDGQQAWQTDHNGRVSRLSGFEERELMKTVYMESYSFIINERLPGGRQYGGLTELESGRAVHRVVVYPFNRDTIEIFLDMESGQLIQMVSRIDNFTTVTSISDIRNFQGVLLLARSRTIAADIPLISEISVERFTPNVALDLAIFSPPRQLQDFKFAASVDKVEVEALYQRGYFFVPATINGKSKLWFLLDSGSSANLIDSAIAHQLGLKPSGSLPARGVAGFEEISLVKTDSISIGGLTLYGQVAGSLDLSRLASIRPTGLPFGGILGYDFLSRLPILVDFQKAVLTLFNPDQFSPPEGGVEIDFDLTMLVPIIDVHLAGLDGRFVVDMGNSGGAIVHHGFSTTHKLTERLQQVKLLQETVSGLGGSVSGHTAFLDSLMIGSIKIDSLQVFLSEASAGLAGSHEIDGNIGTRILENFRVLFDYAGHRLVFYRPEK